MAASRNSRTSRRSKPANRRRTTATRGALALVFVALAALGVAFTAWMLSRGDILAYGDALAHLNIARRILDSRTPGYEQIGTVWLPLPHLLMMPLVGIDRLWRTGLAGSIVSVLCFALSGTFLYAIAARVFGTMAGGTSVAGVAAVGCFALNPNLLYLATTPMTEPLFLCCLLGTLAATLRGSPTLAGIATLCAAMTRYEGWVLIPVVAAFFLVSKGLRAALVFGAIASAGPLYWLGHNYYFYSDALDFYRGPWSAKAIYARGGVKHPADGSWWLAFRYFAEAARQCVGFPLAIAGALGLAVALWQRAFWPLALLLAVPAFLIFSLYSGGTPIHVPGLWPYTWYNSRYGMTVLPLAALCAAGLTVFAGRWTAMAVVAAAISVWIAYPRMDNWVVWKESQVNSAARRVWTREAAAYLGPRYRKGAGILTSFSDLTGIYAAAGIPLKEALHEGNGPHWQASVLRPDLFLWEEWAVAVKGDAISSFLQHSQRKGLSYRCVRIVEVEGAPPIEIYRRAARGPNLAALAKSLNDHSVHQGPRGKK